MVLFDFCVHYVIFCEIILYWYGEICVHYIIFCKNYCEFVGIGFLFIIVDFVGYTILI